MMANNLLNKGGGSLLLTPTQMSGPVAINLGNHCLFCLKPQEVDHLLEVSRRNSQLSKDPRPIIHYLTGTDPSYDRGDGELEEMGIPSRATFPPMMCSSCTNILEELYRLHGQLLEVQRMIQKQTELAREMILESQNATSATVSSRQQFYSKIQSSGMSLEEVTTVGQFVDNFHTKIVFEAAGNNSVKFPFRLPPNSSSKSNDNINCSTAHPSSSSRAISCSTRTLKPPTVIDDSYHFPSVNNAHGEIPLELDPSANVKHETAEDESEKHGDLLAELDSFLASDTNTMEASLSAMSRNEEEGEGDQPNFSPLSSLSTDQSSSSWAPSSPEPTTSKRRPKRKCNETVKLNVKAPKVRKSARSSRRKSPSPERSDRPESHLRNANSSMESDDEEGDKQDHVPSSPSSVDHSPSPPGTPEPQPVPVLKKKPRCIRKTNTVPKPLQKRSRDEIIRPLVVQGRTTLQHCDICGELCPSSEIKTHLEAQHHVQDFIKKCPNRSCPYVFSCQRKLDIHLAMPSLRYSVCRRKANLKLRVALPKKCEVCRFRTKIHEELKQHLNTHEATIPEKSMRCPIPECYMKFGLRQSVEEHLYLHDDRDQRIYHSFGKRHRNCDMCGEKIFIPELQKHLEDHNLKDYITHCPNPKCTHVYSCRGKMEKHLRDTPECRKAADVSVIPSTRKCESCNLEVSKHRFINHLQRHELQFKDKETIPCPIASCSDRYVLRQSMEEHLMSHDQRLSKQSREQQCSVCNQRMKMDDVEEHLKDIHKVEEVIRCRRCPFLFHDWETLLDHLENHRVRKTGTGGGGFFCDMCNDDSGFKFMQYESLRTHFFNVHKIGKEFICEVCEQQFFSQTSLSLHHQKNHSGKPKDGKTLTIATKAKNRFECDQCPDTHFSREQSLTAHKIKDHGKAPFTCKFCNQAFVSVHAVQRHEQIHMGVRKSYRCRVDNCGKVYDNMTSWKDHERSHNDDPSLKLFVCDTFGKRFNNRVCLYSHTTKVHEGKKGPRRICEVCGESFATASTLKRHNLIHSGERPFQCTICGQAFRHRDVLNTHLKSHEKKGDSFKPNGPMKNVRKRVAPVATATKDDQAE